MTENTFVSDKDAHLLKPSDCHPAVGIIRELEYGQYFGLYIKRSNDFYEPECIFCGRWGGLDNVHLDQIMAEYEAAKEMTDIHGTCVKAPIADDIRARIAVRRLDVFDPNEVIFDGTWSGVKEIVAQLLKEKTNDHIKS